MSARQRIALREREPDFLAWIASDEGQAALAEVAAEDKAARRLERREARKAARQEARRG